MFTITPVDKGMCDLCDDEAAIARLHTMKDCDHDDKEVDFIYCNSCLGILRDDTARAQHHEPLCYPLEKINE